MGIKAYFLEPTGEQKVFLRTYLGESQCPKRQGYHDAFRDMGTRPEVKNARGFLETPAREDYPPEHWPTHCECGFQFPAGREVNRMVFTRTLYRRSDTGEVVTLDAAPPGAIWNAWWMADWHKGPDGLCLIAKCPGGSEWMIDGRASNCDSPCRNCGRPYHQHSPHPADCPGYQDARPHKCWVREGRPPFLTVGKRGVTCGAGAGSIQTHNWHGFLRHGEFVE